MSGRRPPPAARAYASGVAAPPRPEAPPAFHLLAKPTGAVCNLDCSYCFFLSKEMLYPGSRFRMADELLETYLRQLIEAHARVPEVTIAWQGGEPTLMGARLLPPLGRARRTATCGRASGPSYTIQTNGTLLDAEWAAFFREHDFLVGISIDGPRELHDAYRVNKGGKGSFDEVMRGLDHLADGGRRLERAHDDPRRQRRPRPRGLPLPARRVRCHVRPVHPDHRARRRDGRRRHGAVDVVARPAPVRAGGQTASPGRSVTAEQYGRFLIDVFEEWVRRDVGEVYVQMFDVALANWVGEPPSLCIHSETCGLALALEHTGDLYSCDHFVEPALQARKHPRDAHARARRLAAAAAVRARQARHAAAYCLECDVRFACHGGCPKDRFIATPDGEPGLNYLCAGYKAFFHHVDRPMRLMAERLRRDGAPSEIVALYAAEDAQRGRNDPCTCGSGRKWKHCHGTRDAGRPTQGREHVNTGV